MYTPPEGTRIYDTFVADASKFVITEPLERVQADRSLHGQPPIERIHKQLSKASICSSVYPKGWQFGEVQHGRCIQPKTYIEEPNVSMARYVHHTVEPSERNSVVSTMLNTIEIMERHMAKIAKEYNP